MLYPVELQVLKAGIKQLIDVEAASVVLLTPTKAVDMPNLTPAAAADKPSKHYDVFPPFPHATNP
jgi:hypothetical protein